MKKLLAILTAFVIIFTTFSVTVSATQISNIEWSGAMNYGDDNNADYEIGTLTPTEKDYAKEVWNVNVNGSDGSVMGVYAGQTAIADDMLYITGTKGLYKINTSNGEIIDTLAGAGTTNFFYDYLIIDRDSKLLFVIQASKIQVVNLDSFSLVGDYNTKTEWGISTLGSYHPAQIHNGYLICNGFSFKLNKTPQNGEKYLEAINTVTFGTVDKEKKNYAWSSGVFIGNLFYVTCTDTYSKSATYEHVLLYAVDYKTAKVKFTFDAGLASDYARENYKTKKITQYNTTGQTVYDSKTEYLYWSNRFCGYLFGVKVNKDGSFDKELKTAALSRNSGTVCAPVISSGRLYIAGQGETWQEGGDICVVNVNPESADFMKEIYATNTGIYKVQSNPLLFEDGNTNYIIVQSYISPGYLFYLKDTPNTTSGELKVLAIPSIGNVESLDSGTSSGGAYAYEQIARDDEGRIYAYNESGNLFCFQKSEIAIPTITKNLSSDRIKYELNSKAETLSVEAELNNNNGVLTYQWQESTDKTTWRNIRGATTSSYTPKTDEECTKYYRAVITNSYNGQTETVYSKIAWILTKVYSADTNIKVVSSTSNSITANTKAITSVGDFYVISDVAKPRVWIALNYEEATAEKMDMLIGNAPSWAKTTSSNVYDNITYNYRAYWATDPDSALLPIKVTAENGKTAVKYLLVGTTGGLKTVKYAAVLSKIPDKTMGVGCKGKLEYSVLNYVGSAQSETYKDVKWASDNESVVAVDNNGNITALKAGTATITVSHGYATSSAKITVTTTEHDKNTEVRNAKSATCTEKGYTGDTYCKACGEKIKDGTEINAKGHRVESNSWTVKVKPTTESEGEKTAKCADCGEEITAKIGKITSIISNIIKTEKSVEASIEAEDGTTFNENIALKSENVMDTISKQEQNKTLEKVEVLEIPELEAKTDDNKKTMKKVELIDVLDISLILRDKDQNGNYMQDIEIEPNGTIKVTVKAPTETFKKFDKVLLIHFLDDGTTEKVDYTLTADGKAVFKTDSLSYFAFVGVTSVEITASDIANNTDTTSNSTVPKTGDNSNVLLWLTVLMVSLTGLFIFGKKTKRNEN